jgi:signal transduction histidine kinase
MRSSGRDAVCSIPNAASVLVNGRQTGFMRGSRQWWPGFWLSGTRRPLILLVLAAAIPVCLFAGWVAYLTGQEERTASRRAASIALERVVDQVTSDLATQVAVAETLAASATLDAPDLEMFYREAARLKTARPLWETIELVDPDGNQIINLLRPLGSALAATADRDSFDQVVQTHRAVIGGIGPVGPISGKRFVALRVPVLRGGQLRFVLTVGLVPTAVSSILRDAGAPPGWVGSIVDKSGNIIARTIAEEFELGRPGSPALRDAIARAPEGFYVGRTLEGVEVESVYRTLPHTAGWSAHLGVPTEQLNQPVKRSTFVLVSGGLASLALAAGLAILTARDIAHRRNDEALRSAIALKVSEERGTMAIEAAELGTWRWQVEAGEVLGSERCRTMLGLPAAIREGTEWRWSDRDLLAAIHPDDRELVENGIRRCLHEGILLDVEFRTMSRDGSTHWLRATGRAPLIGPESNAVQGVMADIDPRKRAEAERIELLRRLAQAQEEERRRIARELHDQVGQSVTGLSLGLKGLQTMLADAEMESTLQERVHWLQTLTGTIGRDIHRAALDLRPTALDDLGLYKALLTYADDWSERYGIAIDVQAVGDQGRLPAEVETALYRTVQEALTNVLKHAAAHNVSVLLERKDGQLRLIIEDDGRGIDPDVSAQPGLGGSSPRLGLSGICERLSLIGGTMTLESTPGSGTTLFAEVPLGPGKVTTTS